MTSQPASLHFTTDAFKPAERVSAWRDVYGRLVDLEFEPTDNDTFRGEARIVMHPGLSIGSLSMGRTRFAHPRSLVNSDDVLLVTVENASWRATAFGREVYLQPGDAILGWTAETVEGLVTGDTSIISVPRAAIAPLVGDITSAMHRRIPAGTDILRLLRPYARTLMDESAAPGLQRLATTHVTDLIALMCGASGEGGEVARDRGGRAARLQAIKEDVAKALVHGDVSVGAIAVRHRVTPRTIQKLFENDGVTFTEYVLAARLALAHRMLNDARRAGEKVSSIAFDCGFGDLSHFNRVFRRRYGQSPSDVRANVRRDH